MSEKEKLELARQKRLQKAGISKKQVEENTREEFRKFFIQIKNKIKCDSSLEKIIWLHFKSAGFDRKELFIEGIKHFGYNI